MHGKIVLKIRGLRFIPSLMALWVSATLPVQGLAQESEFDKGNGVYQSIVLSYNDNARTTALAVFKYGGNAFDAFAAAVLVEYVEAAGFTSLSGPLGLMIYKGATGESAFLDAGYNAPLSPSGMWQAGKGDAEGKKILVPGALKGLEELVKIHGSMKFSDLLMPAIGFCESGVRIDETYALMLQSYAEVLKKSDYGRKTFFKDGKPLQVGDTLQQPELCAFLQKVADQGSDYLYRGGWGDAFLRLNHELGGELTKADLEGYQATWHEPRKYSYRGYDMLTSSGSTYGGIANAIAMKAIEPLSFAGKPHYSEDSAALALLLQTIEESLREPLLKMDSTVIDTTTMSAAIAKKGETVAKRVQGLLPRSLEAQVKHGSHSSQTIIADRWGNVVNGTHTINALPWGSGHFVEGVPLNNSGMFQKADLTGAFEPGARVLSALALNFVLRDGKFFLASGSFNSSLIHAGFQYLVNALDYGLEPQAAANLPRFGGRVFNPDSLDLESIKAAGLQPFALDARVRSNVVDELRSAGIDVQQGPFADTGLGCVLQARPDGKWIGGISQLYGVPQFSLGIR